MREVTATLLIRPLQCEQTGTTINTQRQDLALTPPRFFLRNKSHRFIYYFILTLYKTRLYRNQFQVVFD